MEWQEGGWGVGVGFKPVWDTSFQQDLKLIQRKKVGDRSTIFGYTGRALNNSRERVPFIPWSMEWRPLQLCNVVALGMRLNSEEPCFCTELSSPTPPTSCLCL